MCTRSLFAVALSLGLLLAACTDDEAPTIETAEVRSGEVVQTVAAPARLQPRAQARIDAPASGQVAELLVDDGDRVEEGDVVLRIASEAVATQVEQAATAVEAAESLAADSAGAGFDVAPIVGGFRGQLDAVVPGILDGLRATTATTESSLEAAIAAVTTTSRAAEAWSRALEDAVTDTSQTIEDVRDIARELEDAIDTEEFERVAGERLDRLDKLETDVLPDLALGDPGRTLDAGGVDAPQLPAPVDTSGVIASLVEAQQGVEEAREALRRTELGFADASRQLGETEDELSRQAERSAAAQAQALEAQVAQAEIALQAAQARSEGLTVTAPIAGIVELSRGGEAPADPGDLLGELGDAGGAFADGGVGSLLGGGAVGGGPVTSADVVEQGATVAAGQPLLTIHDTSWFTAMADVDEIDVVEVAEGQQAEILVDAFAGTELTGVVEHVAFSPRRDATGGATYEVEVRLTELPEELRPRAGLTASAEIEVRRVDSELVVPTSALLRRADGEVVHVVRDGVVEEVAVRIEAIGEEDAAIDGELDQGEEVVTIGVELVSDGDELPR